MEITQITIKRANGDEWQLSVEEARELRGQLNELLGVQQSTTWVYPNYPQYPTLRTDSGTFTVKQPITTSTAHPDPDGIGKRIAVKANEFNYPVTSTKLRGAL